ncbi:MAG: tellurite resistance/C4-dicarboxylate transporter family protein [Alphaproteobacteria bacterium]|nr:tellurite resistance/C4-dicarboxylate transporter family protein [Alphaproteobacteria bacterium]
MLVKLADNYPHGAFAFVMATGIVSIAAASLGHGRIAAILLAVNVIAFALLWLWMLLPLTFHPLRFLLDATDFRRGPSALTIVAGTSVLGEQISLLTSHHKIAAVLWLGASALWVGLIYCGFAQATVGVLKPRLRAGLDGSWLLAVVAPQSLATLGIRVADVFPAPEAVIFASLCLFLLGGIFYFIIITLIFCRWLFEPMTPEELTPSYWINMGAAAITTLAGAQLAVAADLYPLLAGLRGFIVGGTVLFWALASWWIPLLIVVMTWRHAIGRVKLSYELEYWSMVFPLGMYTAATSSFAQAVVADFLNVIPRVFLWVAVAAWCVVFVAMMTRLPRLLGVVNARARHRDGDKL